MSDTLFFEDDLLPEDMQELQGRFLAEGARWRAQLPTTERLARTANELMATRVESTTQAMRCNSSVTQGKGSHPDSQVARWRMGGFAAALAVAVVFVAVFRLFGQPAPATSPPKLLLVSQGVDTLLALRPTTGAHVWSFHVKDWGMMDAVTMQGMTVLFALGPSDSSGITTTGLFALDTATGKLRWRFPSGNVHFHDVSQPTVVQDTVYLAAGDSGYGSVLALDLLTGHTRWQTPLLGASTIAAVAVGEGMVYIGGQGITALRASDGQIIWQHTLPGTEHSGVSSVTLARDRLVVETNHSAHTILDQNHPNVPYDADQLFGLQPSDGRVVWRFSATMCILANPGSLFDPDMVFFATASSCSLGLNNVTTHALRVRDGQLLWTYPGTVQAQDTQAVYVTDAYYVQNSKLHAISRLTGVELWVRQPGENELLPTDYGMFGSRLFFQNGHNLGTIESLDAQGHLRWQIPIADTDGIGLLPSGAILFATVSQGNGPTTLYAYRASDGKLLWQQPDLQPLFTGYLTSP